MRTTSTLPIWDHIASPKVQQPWLLILALLAFLFAQTEVCAQTDQVEKKSWISGLLNKRSSRVNYDTTYIARPYGQLTLKVRTNISGDGIHAKGRVDNYYTRANLETSKKITTSIAAIYKGIGVGMALNPAKIFGNYNDYELNLNLYNPSISFDASFHRSKSLSGTIKREEREIHVNKGDADMQVFNVTAYYTFNHRRFSFPAAFTQSYLQKKSAGSWLAGLAFQGGSLNTSKKAAETMPDLKIKAIHLGVGGGYAHNFVVHDKWLFHISILPTVVVLDNNSLTINGNKKSSQPIRLNLLLNEHFAMVYNFSPRYFASLTAVVNNSLFDDEMIIVNQNKWRVRVAFGLRL
ncbi:MAG: DUF4421 domain-containing protein [Prevotella sp.]|nr:DUF4421 domain-containing protein [Prevotella sp.]